jgi:hypothetical protein
MTFRFGSSADRIPECDRDALDRYWMYSVPEAPPFAGDLPWFHACGFQGRFGPRSWRVIKELLVALGVAMGGSDFHRGAFAHKFFKFSLFSKIKNVKNLTKHGSAGFSTRISRSRSPWSQSFSSLMDASGAREGDHTSRSLEGNLDARVLQDEIGLIYDIWGQGISNILRLMRRYD